MESQLLQHESMKKFLQLLNENDMSEQKQRWHSLMMQEEN